MSRDFSTGGNRRFSPARFKALVIHVIDEMGPLNEQQLSNVLFKIDFDAYRKLGQSVTGATYLKAPDGVIVTNKGRPQRNLLSGRVLFGSYIQEPAPAGDSQKKSPSSPKA